MKVLLTMNFPLVQKPKNLNTKLNIRWCQLVAVRSMRSCWKEMHNKLVWMRQWRRLGEIVAQVGWDDETNSKNAMGTQIRCCWFRQISAMVQNLGLINGDLYAASNLFPIQGGCIFSLVEVMVEINAFATTVFGIRLKRTTQDSKHVPHFSWLLKFFATSFSRDAKDVLFLPRNLS